MSFKTILVKEAKQSGLTPDFLYKPGEEHIGLFTFTKQAGDFNYSVIFQIHRFTPEFTVNLEVTKNLTPTKHPELFPKINERLGRLVYAKDYWWPYSKEDLSLTTTSIKQALQLLKECFDGFFAQAVEEFKSFCREKKKINKTATRRGRKKQAEGSKRYEKGIVRAKSEKSVTPDNILKKLIAANRESSEG